MAHLNDSCILIRRIGEVAEWSNAAVLKTVDSKGSGGSNPSLSANNWLLNGDILGCVPSVPA